MRALLGEPDKPDSAYILVIRGIYEDGYTYWLNHKKLYPIWGCLLFPDIDEVFSFRPEIIDSILRDQVIGSSIHCLFSAEYNKMSDAEVLEYVKTNYPRYSEDNDPPLSLREELSALRDGAFRSTEKALLDAIKGNMEAINALASIKTCEGIFKSVFDTDGF